MKKCKWCDGTGDDGGGYNACPDCECTGYVGGRSAVEKHQNALREKDKKNEVKYEKTMEDQLSN